MKLSGSADAEWGDLLFTASNLSRFTINGTTSSVGAWISSGGSDRYPWNLGRVTFGSGRYGTYSPALKVNSTGICTIPTAPMGYPAKPNFSPVTVIDVDVMFPTDVLYPYPTANGGLSIIAIDANTNGSCIDPFYPNAGPALYTGISSRANGLSIAHKYGDNFTLSNHWYALKLICYGNEYVEGYIDGVIQSGTYDEFVAAVSYPVQRTLSINKEVTGVVAPYPNPAGTLIAQVFQTEDRHSRPTNGNNLWEDGAGLYGVSCYYSSSAGPSSGPADLNVTTGHEPRFRNFHVRNFNMNFPPF